MGSQHLLVSHAGGGSFGSRLSTTNDSFCYIMDRVKDIIIRGGENISCAEVRHLCLCVSLSWSTWRNSCGASLPSSAPASWMVL
jgi:hypothetical protein